MKALLKAFSDSSAMWRGWRGIGSPRGSMKKSVLVFVQGVGHGRDGLIREGVFKEKRVGHHSSKRMVQGRSEWLGFVRGNAWGITLGMNPLP